MDRGIDETPSGRPYGRDGAGWLVFQMGEDINVGHGNFKCTVGFADKYGDLRVKDTPSWQGFVGMGAGAALTGLRPVAVELMFADCAWSAATSSSTRWPGSLTCPRCSATCPWWCVPAPGWRTLLAAQHSQSIMPGPPIPGVKVVVPPPPASARGCSRPPSGQRPHMFLSADALHARKFNDVPRWRGCMHPRWPGPHHHGGRRYHVVTNSA